MKNQGKMTKRMVLLTLFISMSVVGGYIKIPNPITSSIAFDSLPAYLASLALGGVPGAIIGFLGHLTSAAIGGFPLSLPIHLLIAFQMAVIMLVFNFIAERYYFILAISAGIILNGIAAPACLILIPGLGMPAFAGAVVPLTLTSALNILIAALVYKSTKNNRVIKEFKESNDGI